MGGTLFRVAIGAFLVWLASQMGTFAEEILGRVRESVQASELLEIDRYVYKWAALDAPRVRAPDSQAEFEAILKETLAGGRDPTRDRWGRPYVYEPIKTLDPRDIRYRIVCRGPDGKLGTVDDINVDREGDRTSIDRDPARIAEQAIDRKRRLDRDMAARLRALVEAAPIVSATVRDPAVDRARIARELEAATRDLGRLLEKP